MTVSRGWALSAVLVLVMLSFLARPLLPGRSVPVLIAAAAVLTLLLLISVLIHEAAHAILARAFGQRVLRVNVDVLGGQTELATAGPSARDAWVALAGPVTSAAVGGAAHLVALTLPAGGTARLLAETVAVVNLLLAVFNVLPAVPLDGGEVLRAVVFRLTGSERRAQTAGLAGAALVCGALAGGAAWLALTGTRTGRAQAVVLTVLAVHLAVLAWQDLRRSPVRDGRSGATPAGGGPAESGPGGDQGPPVLLPGDGPAEIAALLRRFPGNEFRAVDDDGRPLRTLTRAELLRRLATDHPGGPAR